MKVIGYLVLILFSFLSRAQEPVFAINRPNGHYSGIQKFVVTGDNTTAITFGKDKSICFWDIESGTLIRKVWLDMGEGNRGQFIDVDIDHNRNLLAIARLNSEGDPVVNLFDLNRYQIIGTFAGFTPELGFVRFDPNSKFIITGLLKSGDPFFEPIKLWKIPGFGDQPFVVTSPSASIASVIAQDLCFYDNGSKIWIINQNSGIYNNLAIDISYNPNAIPNYRLNKIKPISNFRGYIGYVEQLHKTLGGSYEGQVSLFDNEGNEDLLFELGNTGKRQIGDTGIAYLSVAETAKYAYIRASDWGTKQSSGIVIDLETMKRTDYKIPNQWFYQVVFISSETFLGFNNDGFWKVDFKQNTQKQIFRNAHMPFDPIAFGPSKTILFDSAGQQFNFQSLQLGGSSNESIEGSYQKSSFNDLKVELFDELKWSYWQSSLKISGKTTFFNPPDYAINTYSFLNSGHLLLNVENFNYQSKTIIYDINNTFKGTMNPYKELVDQKNFLAGIAPSADVESNLFFTKDVNGLVYLYDEETENYKLKFEANMMFPPLEHINVYTKKDRPVLIPEKNYQGIFEKNDPIISVNDFEVDNANAFFGHLETLDTSEPIVIKVDRNGQELKESVKLNTLKSIYPLLTFICDGNEWLTWSPQGYYASSAGGERLGGWVVNKGVNAVAEYHPIYDFKKKYYNPELIKLIAKEESFTTAMATYNKTAMTPIGSENNSVAQNLPPSIYWSNPASRDTTFNQSLVKLTAKIDSDSKITNAKILMNGRTVLRRDQVSIREIQTGKYEVNFEIDLLSENNIINLFVENVNGSTISEERIIKAVQILEGIERYKPNLYMVSIGVSNHSIQQYTLNYADDDALALSDLYVNQKGKLFKDVFQRTLVNEEATRENILDAFYWLEKNATQKDVVVIFIASHGINERDKFYILPYDGNPERIRITGVDWVDFSDILGNLPSKVMMFLDACHSGKLGSNLLASRGDTDLLEAVRALATEENGVVIMAASTGKEYSFESSEWGHGAFTLALLEGMKEGHADLNGNGIVNIREIDYYVAERVKELSGGKQHPTTQKPSVVAEFPLVEVNN
jgi:WD40 repeat protein